MILVALDSLSSMYLKDLIARKNDTKFFKYVITIVLITPFHINFSFSSFNFSTTFYLYFLTIIKIAKRKTKMTTNRKSRRKTNVLFKGFIF